MYAGYMQTLYIDFGGGIFWSVFITQGRNSKFDKGREDFQQKSNLSVTGSETWM